MDDDANVWNMFDIIITLSIIVMDLQLKLLKNMLSRKTGPDKFSGIRTGLF